MDPFAQRRKSLSQVCSTVAEAESWIAELQQLVLAGVDPLIATITLGDYGESIMPVALRGLQAKTLDPYTAGWRKRVVPTLGHLPVRMITNGAVDRAVHAGIAAECSRSTVKNSLAILVRVLEQAVRDGIVEHNRARVTGWQRAYQHAEDELDNPRALALPDWAALHQLAAALVARSARPLPGLGRHRRVHRLHRGPDRRDSGSPASGHQPHDLDVDRLPADHPEPRRPERQGDQRQAGASSPDHPRDPAAG
jgi:hypothetical protein